MGKNLAYLGHNLFPMAVMIVPMTAIMVQLVANYARDPVPVGSVDDVVTNALKAAAKADAADVNESLAKLAESFRALSETVKEQQQRLGRVEKQFGLPNSAAPAERVSKATVEDVGWPLDLNKPKDRESVDKAISFHDL